MDLREFFCKDSFNGAVQVPLFYDFDQGTGQEHPHQNKPQYCPPKSLGQVPGRFPTKLLGQTRRKEVSFQ